MARRRQGESFELRYEDDPARTIRGRIEPPSAQAVEPWPTVIVLHGFKGFMNWGFFPELGRRLARAGYAAVLFNTSGSGIGPDLESFTELEAFAANTFTRELEDLALVRRFLAARPAFDATRLGLFGHSRGGGIALLHAAAAGDIAALVTWAAISTVERFSPEVVSAWREDGFTLVRNARTGQDMRLGLDVLRDVEEHQRELNIRAACAQITAPTLLLHGEADEGVPFSEARALMAAFRPGVARLSAHAGAGHTFGARHPLDEVPASLERAMAETTDHFREFL